MILTYFELSNFSNKLENILNSSLKLVEKLKFYKISTKKNKILQLVE